MLGLSENLRARLGEGDDEQSDLSYHYHKVSEVIPSVNNLCVAQVYPIVGLI